MLTPDGVVEAVMGEVKRFVDEDKDQKSEKPMSA